MEEEISNTEETPSPEFSNDAKKTKWPVGFGAIIFIVLTIVTLAFLWKGDTKTASKVGSEGEKEQPPTQTIVATRDITSFVNTSNFDTFDLKVGDSLDGMTVTSIIPLQLEDETIYSQERNRGKSRIVWEGNMEFLAMLGKDTHNGDQIIVSPKIETPVSPLLLNGSYVVYAELRVANPEPLTEQYGGGLKKMKVTKIVQNDSEYKYDGIFPTSVYIKEVSEPESRDFTYGGNSRTEFYRKDNEVFVFSPLNESIGTLKLSNADPDSFSFLEGLAGYDKNNFHYLKFDDENRTYLPVSVPINSKLKQLFDLVESPGEDVKISWTSSNDVIFEDVTYRRLSEYGDFNAFRIGIFELLNNGSVIGYLWTNGLSKTNVANNKLYLFTDSNTTGYKKAVYEVAYGDQPEMIIDIDPDKTTFKPGGNKIYYTKSYESLDFYEYDTVARTERKITVQYSSTTTGSSRITLSPDERHLLVQSSDGYAKTSTLLVDIHTGEVEIIREKKVAGKGDGDFPFAVSPSNDKVFFLKVPYEGYLFTNPVYVKKDATTGTWGGVLNIPLINMEVGGGWNIDTGQWSISPSGRHLAVADATENSAYFCGGMGDTPKAHNVIKILDLETLETRILTMKSSTEDFTLNSWSSDESGIFATIRKVEMNPERPEWNCVEPSGEGVQEFYPL